MSCGVCANDGNVDNVKIMIKVLESEAVEPPELLEDKRKATFEEAEQLQVRRPQDGPNPCTARRRAGKHYGLDDPQVETPSVSQCYGVTVEYVRNMLSPSRKLVN